MTSAIPADTSSGGMRINIIPKDGGNIVSGAVFLGGTNGTWQSDNVDDALRAREFTDRQRHRAHPELQRRDGRAGQEGQALVLHGGAAHLARTRRSPTCPRRSRCPTGRSSGASSTSSCATRSLRLTWQVSPRNKFAIWGSADLQAEGEGFRVSARTRGSAPSATREHGMHYVAGQARWTHDLEQQVPVRGRLLHLLPALLREHPARDVQDARLRRSGTRTRRRPTRALNARAIYPTCAFATGCTSWDGGIMRQPERPRQVVAGVGVVCDRDAQHQGGVPGFVRPVRQLPASATAT